MERDENAVGVNLFTIRRKLCSTKYSFLNI